MLQAFYFDGRTISFQNAFLDSIYYQRCQKNGKFDDNMTTTEKPKSFFSKLANAFNKPDPYDNGNLSIATINGSFIALTETPLGVIFDPKTLKTNKPFNLNEYLEGHLTTAQFQYDRYTKAWYNYMTNFGKTSSYNLYKICS
jgi:beta,beta-carotene 9',10'-dioxygenase